MSLIEKRKQMAKPFYVVQSQVDSYVDSLERPVAEERVRMRAKLLTEKEIANRAAQREERESRLWLILAPAIVALCCAAALFDIIWKEIRP